MPPRRGGEVDGVISKQRVEMHEGGTGRGDLILCTSEKNLLTAAALLMQHEMKTTYNYRWPNVEPSCLQSH